MYKVIALIGKSGSGKNSILSTAVYNHPSLHTIISCTTRPPREGEKDGVNYYFLTEKKFKENIKNDQMLEYTVFNDWMYGTTYSSLDPNLVNIGVFNPAGVESLLKKDDIDLTVLYVQTTDKMRLMRQLCREKNPNVKEIIRRFSTDDVDFADLKFDYIPLENTTVGDLDCAIQTVVETARNLEDKKD